MGDFFDLIQSFGFSRNDKETIGIVSLLVLLGNFSGGLMGNILVAFGGPIRERKLTERTSFRLALVFELMFLAYIIYYQAALSTTGVTTAQIIYWSYLLLAGPLMAALGGQLMYLAFSSKIDGLKQDYKDFEKAVEDEEAKGDAGPDDE